MALSVEQRREKVELYLSLVATGTAAQIMEMYGPDPRLEDPVGSEPKQGRQALTEFYAGVEPLETATTLREFRASGDDAAAFAFDVATKLGDDTMTISVIEVMTFDAEGLICDMKAYWSPEADSTFS
jgi:steroid delta-isomerase